MKKVLLVDDHNLVLDGLSRIIEEAENFQLVGKASNGREALNYLDNLKIDILMTDLDMPIMNGQELTIEVKSKFPEVKILVLTMHNEKSIIEQMLKMGADGYIVKSADPQDLLLALENIAKEKKHIGKEAKISLENYSNTPENNLAERFTTREIEILKWIASGLTNKEIGEKLFISHRTVDTHRTNLMKKLDVHNIAGLIRFAIKNGLVE